MATREDWQRRLGPLYGGAVALVHSTPWRWPTAIEHDDARAPAWVVALGLPIGAAAYVVALLLRAAGLPPPLAAIVGLAALALASAAIVERGVAERVAALARPTRARDADVQGAALASVTLAFLTVLRCAAIASVAPSHWLGVFVATAATGRWAAIFLQAIGDPVAPDDRRSLVAAPAPAWLTGALSAALVALAIAALGKIGVVAIALVAIAVFGLGLDAQRREGGLTAAVIAVAAAIGELAILLVATI